MAQHDGKEMNGCGPNTFAFNIIPHAPRCGSVKYGCIFLHKGKKYLIRGTNFSFLEITLKKVNTNIHVLEVGTFSKATKKSMKQRMWNFQFKERHLRTDLNVVVSGVFRFLRWEGGEVVEVMGRRQSHMQVSWENILVETLHIFLWLYNAVNCTESRSQDWS